MLQQMFAISRASLTALVVAALGNVMDFFEIAKITQSQAI